MVQIYCKNTKTVKNVAEGTPLLDIVDSFEFERPYPIVSAKVNNVSQGLKYRVYQSRDVEFVDLRDGSGMRAYCRSLCFLLVKAVRDALPGYRLYIEHPISGGYYCNLRKPDRKVVSQEEVDAVKERMQEIIRKDLPFHRHELQTEEAIKIFADRGMDDKVKLFSTSQEVYSDYYTLGETVDYYYGCLVPSASFLQIWDLVKYENGLILRLPDHNHPDRLAPAMEQPRTFEVFAEYLRWNVIMGLSNVGDLNKACQDGHATELIQVSEALQERKIVKIAEEIEKRYNDPENPLKIVLITGPSSSGKTTFCNRLSVQLKACGLHPLSLSTDDYFVNRVETPKLPNGMYDFDHFDTVDHAMLESDMLKVLAGERIDIPEYDFVTGKREYKGKSFKLTKGSIILIEGIHALNPLLLPSVEDKYKYRIFINTLTSVSLDNHNTIPPTDTRLLRRIMRDYTKGYFSAMETIRQWPSVCEGEEKWIRPYQETADTMFNSSYLIEFAVLRTRAEQILSTVPKNKAEYAEAHRLMHFLHYFVPVDDRQIPFTSLLREFLGPNV